MRRIASAVRRGVLTLILVAGTVPAGLVQAQQIGLPRSAILTIATDRLFAESEYGRRIAGEIEAESAVLAAENRRIEAELTAEEKELTDRRPEIDPEAFRALADAFDEKVQAIRREQDAKARAISELRDSARARFLQAARPVLESLMREAEAGVVLERSSVFLSANATDVTDLAIDRIDAAIGDGGSLQDTPPEQ